MPSGGRESKKDEVDYRARRASGGGDGDSKTNDLSAEDWNFLLHWQGQQDEGNWTLALAERLLPVSQAPQNTAASHAAREPSPVSGASLDPKETSLGEYREQVKRWEQSQWQRSAHCSASAAVTPTLPSPFSAALAATPTRNISLCELLGVTSQAPRSAPPLLLHTDLQAGQAPAPSCWPGSLPSSPTKPAGRAKRDTTSPCSTTAPPNVVPPWLGQAISLATWFPRSRQELSVSPGQPPCAPAQQTTPSQGNPALASALPLFAGASVQRRQPGRPRKLANVSPPNLEGLPSSGAAAVWPDSGLAAAQRGRRGRIWAAGQGARGATSDAEAEGSPAGAASEEGAGADRSATGKATPTLAPGRAGRVRWPSKRTLDAAEEDHLDKPDSPPERRSTAPPSSKAAKLCKCAGAGGAAQKRQPGAAASSVYRGVSRHRLTQRWEASLWLSGKQMYLGGFVNEEDAARAYDLAALACKGRSVPTNFAPSDYDDNLSEISGSSREEIVAWVRRRSSAFSRGRSRFRGVSGQAGHWEARIGTFGDRKNVSFGIHETEEEAARQYDRALIVEKGRAAKTNFPLQVYDDEVIAFEGFVAARFGSSICAGARQFLAAMALPFDASAPDGFKASLPPVREKNKGGRPRNTAASIINASALQQALASKPAAAAPRLKIGT